MQYAGTLILGDQVSGKIIERNIINYVINYVTRIDTSYNKRYYTWTTSTGMNDYYSKVGGSTIDITLMNIIRTTKWMK